jgi:hypothetical protein
MRSPAAEERFRTPHRDTFADLLRFVERPVLASLRKLAIGILRHRGWTNTAQALRHHARDPCDPWSPSASPD